MISSSRLQAELQHPKVVSSEGAQDGGINEMNVFVVDTLNSFMVMPSWRPTCTRE